jgi:predicted PurR-regulated permease PerM
MEFARRSLIAVAVGTAIVLIVLAVVVTARALIVVFAGVLFAVLLLALGDGLARRTRLSKEVSLWIVVGCLAAGVGLAGWFLAAEFAYQFQELGTTLTEFWNKVEQFLARNGWGREILKLLSDGAASEKKSDILGRLVGMTLATLSTLVIALFIGLYVAAAPARYRTGLIALVPASARKRAKEVIDALDQTLRGWLVGTLINMTAVGVATTIGLWLIGVPHALALGLLAFLLEFIPYFGPFLAAAPAVLIAMTVGPADAGYTLLLYVAVQQLEGYLLVPYVYQRSIHLAPALTIGAQLILGTLLGVPGILFATPLTACAVVLTQELYVKAMLGSKAPSRA